MHESCSEPAPLLRSASSLRRASSLCGVHPVLDDSEIDHCESFAIPSSDITLCNVIGQGACGDILRGIWGGRDVAIKRMKCSVSENGDSNERQDMIKEISIMCRNFSALGHPNIVGFHGICIDETAPWLVIEYVGGGSLEDYYQSQRTSNKSWKPDRKKAIVWSLDLAQGLEFLHSQRPPIVHRDIKPANMMLLDDLSHIKLCDFGVSKALRAHGIADSSCTSVAASVTVRQHEEMSGRTGTYRYMAPEVFAEAPQYTTAVDIYSAAMSMWFLFKGEKPFATLDGFSVADLSLRQGLRPGTLKTSSKMYLVANIVERAWDGDPCQRPCASELVAVLKMALDKDRSFRNSVASFVKGTFGRVKSAPPEFSRVGSADSADSSNSTPTHL